MVPLETEVLTRHACMLTGVRRVEGGLVVEMDVRQVPWGERLNLPRGAKVHWSDVRTVDIKDLSVLTPGKLTYRLTYGDGWHTTPGEAGRKTYFALQPHLHGIDLDRQCTTVALRAAVLLAVMSGVGLRCVCWLMRMLFNLEVSKSSLDRWVKECAAQLPDAAEMAQQMHREKPITEVSLDEIFALGQRPKRCTLVLRDEHGRIFATRELEERTEEVVTKFLREVKSWGISPERFYVDGCEAYAAAIRAVFPEAVIQYDYFHVIQNVWKKLWATVVARRKALQASSESAKTPAYAGRLAALAERIWKHRWLFLKRDENMAPEESKELVELLEADSSLAQVRGFAKAVWDLFEKSSDESEAQKALDALLKRAEVKSGSVFEKCVIFLQSRFEDMVAFLRYPGVRRNSLAETGMRFLRRLERGHDGFRGAAGMDCYLRIYQAVKYRGWVVHGVSIDTGLGLSAPAPSHEAPGASAPSNA